MPDHALSTASSIVVDAASSRSSASSSVTGGLVPAHALYRRHASSIKASGVGNFVYASLPNGLTDQRPFALTSHPALADDIVLNLTVFSYRRSPGLFG